MKLNEIEKLSIKYLKRNQNLSDKKFLKEHIVIKRTDEIPIVFYKDVNNNLGKQSNIHAYLVDEYDDRFPDELGNLVFSLDENKSVVLEDIRVGNDVRRNGIGSLLLRVFEETCLDKFGKNTKVYGVVMPEEIEDMDKLIEFYQKNSYSIEKKGTSFPKLSKSINKNLSAAHDVQFGE